MRRAALLAASCLAFAPPALAAPADPAVVAPIQAFIHSFDTGDAKAGAAAHDPAGVTIIDEIPPHIWQGPGALAAWGADLAADATAKGLTEPKVTIAEPTRAEVEGARAYVIVPAVYTYKLKGTPMREAAQMTFALRKGAGGWLIEGWTWTGPYPQAVK